MYAIETDLGKFIGENEKDAKQKLAAAKRQAARVEAEVRKLHKAARQKAEHNGFMIYDRKAREKEFPQGWTVYPVGHNSSGASYQVGENGYTYTLIHHEDGAAKVNTYDRVTHVIHSGNGYPIAICIENHDDKVFAFGAENGVAAWIPLYGIAMEDFRLCNAMKAAQGQ
jgi:GTPase